MPVGIDTMENGCSSKDRWSFRSAWDLRQGTLPRKTLTILLPDDWDSFWWNVFLLGKLPQNGQKWPKKIWARFWTPKFKVKLIRFGSWGATFDAASFPILSHECAQPPPNPGLLTRQGSMVASRHQQSLNLNFQLTHERCICLKHVSARQRCQPENCSCNLTMCTGLRNSNSRTCVQAWEHTSMKYPSVLDERTFWVFVDINVRVLLLHNLPWQWYNWYAPHINVSFCSRKWYIRTQLYMRVLLSQKWHNYTIDTHHTYMCPSVLGSGALIFALSCICVSFCRRSGRIIQLILTTCICFLLFSEVAHSHSVVYACPSVAEVARLCIW
jgi:hypothetical protein